MFRHDTLTHCTTAIAIVVAIAVGASAKFAAAQSAEPEAIIVVGLARVEKPDGQPSLRIEEPQRLRELMGGAVRAAAQRPLLDHAELSAALGGDYLNRFTGCRGEPDCVARLVAPLGARARLAIYGDYQIEGEEHRIYLRALDVREGRVAGEARFALRGPELDDQARWRREVGALLAGAGVTVAAVPNGPSGLNGETPPPTGDGAKGPEGGESGAAPELPPLTNDGDGGDGGKPGDGSFVDNSALDTVSRGIIWHGYLQVYAALGIRGDYRRDLVLFENRLHLDFDTHVGPLRIVGRPEVLYDGLSEEFGVGLRELYAAREYGKLELSVGERILTWGVTDFWPVVDIVNPRDYSRLRFWRPIDEKRPAPVIAGSAVLGRVTLQALGIVLTRGSAYQLDQSRPFAIPIAVPDFVPIEQQDTPDTLSGSGAGATASMTFGSWKTALYALWGRNPLPTVFARVDLTTGFPSVLVENERIAMVAASAQGTLDAIGALIKTEAAYYARIDDRCEDAVELAPGTPSCFYLRRVPNARATAAIERQVVEGLDAHVQLIGEFTRSADVPPLPGAAMALAPGLTPQHRFNPIATLRLQGRWKRDDFRPSAFFYLSLADEDWFANVDLEYHVADGFALSAGGFWFEGYADDPAENQFTIAGSLEHSSNVYVRATAWF